MCINIAGGADIAVPQPLLNFLQAHAVCVKQAGAAMAQIVKADTLHLVCDQKIRKMLTQKVGPNPLSHRVYIVVFLGWPYAVVKQGTKKFTKNKPYKGFSRFRTDLSLVGLTYTLYVLFLIMIMPHGHPFCYAAD